MRSLQEFYELSENQSDPTLFCLFANCEPIVSQKVVQSKKWTNAMDEKIQAIKKIDTWKLATLPKRHKGIGVKWVYKPRKMLKERCKGTKQGFFPKVIINDPILTMMRYLVLLLV